MSEHDDRVDRLIDQYAQRRIDRRQLLRQAALLGVSAGALSPLLAGVAEARSTTARSGRTLRVGPESAGNWIPLDTDTNAQDIWVPPYSCIYEGLTGPRVGPVDWEVVPVLAEHIERSHDGKRIAFTLKRGIPFLLRVGLVQERDEEGQDAPP